MLKMSNNQQKATRYDEISGYSHPEAPKSNNQYFPYSNYINQGNDPYVQSSSSGHYATYGTFYSHEEDTEETKNERKINELKQSRNRK